MRIRHAIAALAMGVAAVLGPMAATAPAQGPAITCQGDACSGQDPMATGCGADAQTLAVTDMVGARLELRWSPTCKTNWARYDQYPRGWYLGSAPLELRAVQDTGYQQVYEFGDNLGPGSSWTSMIYSPTRLVHAELSVACGDQTLWSAAMDCLLNGLVKTDAR